MNEAIATALHSELKKVASKSLIGRLSSTLRVGKELAKKEAKNLPHMPIDEKAAFLSGMFLNPIPGMSVAQLAALRSLKGSMPHALSRKTDKHMQSALSKLKTPKNIVGA
jgi:hypothetical protein